MLRSDRRSRGTSIETHASIRSRQTLHLLKTRNGLDFPFRFRPACADRAILMGATPDSPPPPVGSNPPICTWPAERGGGWAPSLSRATEKAVFVNPPQALRHFTEMRSHSAWLSHCRKGRRTSDRYPIQPENESSPEVLLVEPEGAVPHSLYRAHHHHHHLVCWQ